MVAAEKAATMLPQEAGTTETATPLKVVTGAGTEAMPLLLVEAGTTETAMPLETGMEDAMPLLLLVEFGMTETATPLDAGTQA